MNRINLFFILMLLVLGGLQAGPEYESAVHSLGEKSLKYRVLYPEGFDTSQKYPVLLFLHGAGERGGDNEKQLVHGGQLFITSEFREQHSAVVIFPQCPKSDYWSNAEVEREPDGIQLKFRNGENPTEAMSMVLSMMDSIAGLRYSKDDQIYVGGLSMGGMGTFEILSRRPKMFAAAFPICGGGSPESVNAYAKEVTLWVFHGAKDDVVLPGYSTEMVIALREAGGDVKYTLYKDANHNSWDSALAEPELFQWLFSIRKNSI